MPQVVAADLNSSGSKDYVVYKVRVEGCGWRQARWAWTVWLTEFNNHMKLAGDVVARGGLRVCGPVEAFWGGCLQHAWHAIACRVVTPPPSCQSALAICYSHTVLF